MKFSLRACALALFALASVHAQTAPPAGFTALFNGKDLAGKIRHFS